MPQPGRVSLPYFKFSHGSAHVTAQPPPSAKSGEVSEKQREEEEKVLALVTNPEELYRGMLDALTVTHAKSNIGCDDSCRGNGVVNSH